MCNIDVYQMAAAREKRKNRQNELIKRFKNPIVSFTLNIPGPRKSSLHYTRIHAEGIRIIKGKLHDNIVHMSSYRLMSGDEAYFSIDLPAESLKEIVVEIEEKHELGRIFDIDVLDIMGLSISRRSRGMEPRKCLICSKEAVLCSRSRSHTVEDLLEKIESISRNI